MNKSPRLGGINYQVSGDEMWKLLEIVDKYPGFDECIYQLAAAEKVHQASKIVEQINVKMGIIPIVIFEELPFNLRMAFLLLSGQIAEVD